MHSISGIHHVTAITADAQKNIDFYCNVLGLRLVKLTVNFDDPRSYHLYYGDERGSPGTLLTFFVWPNAPRGRIGPPQVTATAFAVPENALSYWISRFDEHFVKQQHVESRFGQPVIKTNDPDGLNIELVAVKLSDFMLKPGGPVPPENAIQGLHSVTICEEGYENSAALLTRVLGFHAPGTEGQRFRYLAGHGDFAAAVDLYCAPDALRGVMGTGVVHHVAYRTANDSEQTAWRKILLEAGNDVTPLIDRKYFRSLYFREPGGVLFELATEGPGFTVDEDLRELGSSLKLPQEYEAHREKIERMLPRLRLPKWGRGMESPMHPGM